MNRAHARQIVQNAVETTRPRWRQYAQSWKDIDTVFIKHGYEQQGFRFFRMAPILQEKGLLSIEALGGILSESRATAPYNPMFAKGLDAQFYSELRQGSFGPNGILFEYATRTFKEREPANCGRFYWKLLWYMLQACAYLRQQHESSFAHYIINQYADFARHPNLSEAEFLGITDDDWLTFLHTVRPWKNLKGIGPNVFDFIFGDIVEAQFARDSYKFDSANEHFLTVTGIASLISPLQRDTAIQFMRSLELPYSLREINKGIYTYCSLTEAENYGYCRRTSKCKQCAALDICERHLSGDQPPEP